MQLRRSEPYDPYLPRNGSSSGPGQGNAKTAAIQAQIDDTVGIMRDNITKVAERGERLDSLQDKTGECSFPSFPGDFRQLSCCASLVDMRLALVMNDNQLGAWERIAKNANIALHRQPCRIRAGFPPRGEPCPQGEILRYSERRTATQSNPAIFQNMW